MEGFWTQVFLLKVLIQAHLLTDSLVLSSSERRQGCTELGGTELSGFKERARGTAFAQTEVQAQTAVPLLYPSPVGSG